MEFVKLSKTFQIKKYIFLWPGDMVSPGLFQDHLTSLNTAWSYHDSAEGYIFEFAINLQTMNYLQTINLLNGSTTNATLEYLQTGMYVCMYVCLWLLVIQYLSRNMTEIQLNQQRPPGMFEMAARHPSSSNIVQSSAMVRLLAYYSNWCSVHSVSCVVVGHYVVLRWMSV
jgi:hypothetical protein